MWHVLPVHRRTLAMCAQDEDGESIEIITDTTPLRPAPTDEVDAKARPRLSASIKGILGRSRRCVMYAGTHVDSVRPGC